MWADGKVEVGLGGPGNGSSPLTSLSDLHDLPRSQIGLAATENTSSKRSREPSDESEEMKSRGGSRSRR